MADERWTIYVCPVCGHQVDLRWRRWQDVRCYGLAGSHGGVAVEQVIVVRETERNGASTSGGEA